MPTTQQLIEESNNLETYGSEYRTLESYMMWCKSMEWDSNPFYVAIYNFLKATMYYNNQFQSWLDK